MQVPEKKFGIWKFATKHGLDFFFCPLKTDSSFRATICDSSVFFSRCVVKEARLQQQDRRSFHGRAEQVLYSF